MTFDTISAGCNPDRNDDYVALFSTANLTDILVIDGATSVAEQDYVDPARGDVAWFVQAFAAELEPMVASERSQAESVQAAIDAVQLAFRELIGDRAVPVFAWPIAALTWVRIAHRDGASIATLYSLGDCKTLLRGVDGPVYDPDPFFNPQEAILQAEIARLRTEGVHNAAQRRERLLPMLRERRVAQNHSPAPSVLCLRPQGRFAARTCTFHLAPGAALLVMTDGFYRLVDPYGLYTDAQLIGHCAGRGLESVLKELRGFERGDDDTGERAVKSADDASAAFCLMA